MDGMTWGRVLTSFAIGALGSLAGAAVVSFWVSDYVVQAHQSGTDVAFAEVRASVDMVNDTVIAQGQQMVAMNARLETLIAAQGEQMTAMGVRMDAAIAAQGDRLEGLISAQGDRLEGLITAQGDRLEGLITAQSDRLDNFVNNEQWGYLVMELGRVSAIVNLVAARLGIPTDFQ
jgi:hypothetical protein